MEGVPGWTPGDPCPCGERGGPPGGCGVTAFKLNRFGHASRICGSKAAGATQVCRSCVGRGGRNRNIRRQSRVLKDMAAASGVRMDRAPNDEEFARFPFWHLESKAGDQVPKALSGAFVTHAERQAELAAAGVASGWAVVFTLPDGRRRLWADYDTFLRFIAEKGETDVAPLG